MQTKKLKEKKNAKLISFKMIWQNNYLAYVVEIKLKQQYISIF